MTGRSDAITRGDVEVPRIIRAKSLPEGPEGGNQSDSECVNH